MLTRDNISEEQRDKYGAVIDRQIDRILAMSDEVLDFVRGDMQLSLGQVNPKAMVQEVYDTYASVFRGMGINLTCTATESNKAIPTITADEHKLWRALQNLISNAKDAMPKGGELRVEAKVEADQLCFEIADTGGGIPDVVRERLFQPFTTHGKKCGTGLGLAIVKSIVDAHGGTIGVTVNEGVGSTFKLVVPALPPRKGERNRTKVMQG